MKSALRDLKICNSKAREVTLLFKIIYVDFQIIQNSYLETSFLIEIFLCICTQYSLDCSFIVNNRIHSSKKITLSTYK